MRNASLIINRPRQAYTAARTETWTDLRVAVSRKQKTGQMGARDQAVLPSTLFESKLLFDSEFALLVFP